MVHHVSTEQGSLREEQRGGLDQGVGGWGSVFKFSRSRRKQGHQMVLGALLCILGLEESADKAASPIVPSTEE